MMKSLLSCVVVLVMVAAPAFAGSNGGRNDSRGGMAGNGNRASVSHSHTKRDGTSVTHTYSYQVSPKAESGRENLEYCGAGRVYMSIPDKCVRIACAPLVAKAGRKYSLEAALCEKR